MYLYALNLIVAFTAFLTTNSVDTLLETSNALSTFDNTSSSEYRQEIHNSIEQIAKPTWNEKPAVDNSTGSLPSKPPLALADGRPRIASNDTPSPPTKSTPETSQAVSSSVPWEIIDSLMAENTSSYPIGGKNKTQNIMENVGTKYQEKEVVTGTALNGDTGIPITKYKRADDVKGTLSAPPAKNPSSPSSVRLRPLTYIPDVVKSADSPIAKRSDVALNINSLCPGMRVPSQASVTSGHSTILTPDDSPPDKISVPNVTLTTAVECEVFQGQVNMWHENSSLVMSAYTETTYVYNQFCSWTFLAPPGKSIKIMFEEFELGESSRRCAEGIVRTVEGDELSGPPMFDYCRWGLPNDIISDGNTVQVQLSLFAGVRGVRLRFKLQAIPDYDRPKLNVVYVTPEEGYVTSPGFDGYSKYPSRVLDNVTLHVPADHVIMVGFPHFDLHSEDNVSSCSSLADDNVSLFEKTEVGEKLVWRKCGVQSIFPRIFNNTIIVSFFSDGFLSRSGFNMTFTIHKKDEGPRQFQDKKFDCRTPFYPRFKVHLHCNLVAECKHGEDELYCPYNKGKCNGSIAFEDKCYEYFDWFKDITWTDAYNECRQRGAVLASLNTPREWNAIENALDAGHRASVVFIGLRTADPNLPAMYRKMWQWADGTVAYFVRLKGHHVFPSCAALPWGWGNYSETVSCDTPRNADFICEYGVQSKLNSTSKPRVEFPRRKSPEETIQAIESFDNSSLVSCPEGHLTFDFLSCDPGTHCGISRYQTECKTEQAGSIPTFACDDEIRTLPYTLLCDHRADCLDSSDEEFCSHPACPDSTCKRSLECLSYSHWCDSMQHCVDGTDEENCYLPPTPAMSRNPPPAVIDLDGYGNFTQTVISSSAECPDTHFRCSGQSAYCLPVYVRCNGVLDCPDHEDEEDCDSYTCPGYYRCRASSVCVHVKQLCDGVFQCPLQDDERMCGFRCPRQCHCQGLVFVCDRPFLASEYPGLRYLDGTGSGMALEDLDHNTYLIRLILKDCGIKELLLLTFPNLLHLDLSYNRITSVNMAVFQNMRHLRTLNLSNNLIAFITSGASTIDNLYLQHVDLSKNRLEEFNTAPFANISNIRMLNISFSTIREIGKVGFDFTKSLEVLDMRETPIENFPNDMLKSLTMLRTVHADNYRICCKATLPKHFDMSQCYAPSDEISSCEDLLRTNTYRVFLWFFACMSIIGNVGCFIYRFCIKERESKIGFDVLVTNLSVSDVLIGVYLVMIGVADQLYQGTYIWYDRAWKNSVFCKIAGFLCLLSSEVSAFIICLITLDRFLVFRYPFSMIHFRRRSAQVACCLAWIAGLALAGIPLLPLTSHWQFYGHTGICVPLPITKDTANDGGYAFAILSVLNLILFLLIALGQLLIFLSVRRNHTPTFDPNRIKLPEAGKHSQDIAIARTLATIVLTDFLCWFPITIVGLLASEGVPISDEVNVGIAIFVLPLNSALNPFLYTFKTQIQRRHRAKQAKILRGMEKRILRELYAAEDGSIGFRGNPLQREAVDRIRTLVKRGSSGNFSSRTPSICSKRSVRNDGNGRTLNAVEETSFLLTKHEVMDLLRETLEKELITEEEITSLLASQARADIM